MFCTILYKSRLILLSSQNPRLVCHLCFYGINLLSVSGYLPVFVKSNALTLVNMPLLMEEKVSYFV